MKKKCGGKKADASEEGNSKCQRRGERNAGKETRRGRGGDRWEQAIRAQK